MPNIKIFFFDMEGTLFKKDSDLDNGKVAPSAWTVLAKKISNECYLEEEQSKDRWLNNEYKSYTEWMADTIKIQLKHGMNRSHLDSILKLAEFHRGAVELLDYLKLNNIITVLISGGFKALANKAQVELKIDHSYSACEYFFDSKGNVCHFNLLPTDEEGKLIFMRHLASEYSVSLEECAFIGDGKNDVHLARACGLSIAFNAQPELKAICNFHLDQETPDLFKIIGLIDG